MPERLPPLPGTNPPISEEELMQRLKDHESAMHQMALEANKIESIETPKNDSEKVAVISENVPENNIQTDARLEDQEKIKKIRDRLSENTPKVIKEEAPGLRDTETKPITKEEAKKLSSMDMLRVAGKGLQGLAPGVAAMAAAGAVYAIIRWPAQAFYDGLAMQFLKALIIDGGWRSIVNDWVGWMKGGDGKVVKEEGRKEAKSGKKASGGHKAANDNHGHANDNHGHGGGGAAAHH